MGGGAFLRFAGPHLFGEARYGDGLSGRLALRYPLPGGGLRGEVDLGEGRFLLQGEGAWEAAWTGRFCLPAPLGACSGLALEASGRLAYGGLAFAGGYRYAAPEGYLGEVAGEGRLSTPYGEVRLSGRGLGLDLEGRACPWWGGLTSIPSASPTGTPGRFLWALASLTRRASTPGLGFPGRTATGRRSWLWRGFPGSGWAFPGEG